MIYQVHSLFIINPTTPASQARIMARAMTVLSDRKLLPEKDVRRTQWDVRRCAVGDFS